VGQDGPVRFLGAAPDNSSGVITGLYLYFDRDIAGLSSDDITIDGPATVVPDMLQKNVFGMAGIYRAALDVTGDGEITVKVKKSGVAVDPPSREAEASLVQVTFDGAAGTGTTTQLTLTFDERIDWLSESDITLGAGVTGAKAEGLSWGGPCFSVFSVAVSVGDVRRR
jgi:hypothetical protein